MKLTMVHPAKWYSELITHSAPECARLCKGEVMRVRWHAAAHEARLTQHEFPVVLVAQANPLAQSADHVTGRLLLSPLGKFLVCACIAFGARYHAWLGGRMRRLGRARTFKSRATAPIVRGRSIRRPVRIVVDLAEPRLKCFLDKLGIWSW